VHARDEHRTLAKNLERRERTLFRTGDKETSQRDAIRAMEEDLAAVHDRVRSAFLDEARRELGIQWRD
jgi:hypothetical protein